MSKLVIFKFGEGSFAQGFPVTLQIGEEGQPSAIEVRGRFPVAPEIPLLYQQWQNLYYRLGGMRIEVPPVQVTNVSTVTECDQAAQKLRGSLIHWWSQASVRDLREQVQEEVQRHETARVIVQTQDLLLRKLPWHLWTLFERRPGAEMALCADYAPASPPLRSPVKILAVLGNSEGIEVQADRAVLEQLPGAKMTLLEKPRRQQLSEQLWSQPWDILFFAGNSSSEEHGQIQINQLESLSLDQLRYALKAAVRNGLKLAIFNSCDGLRLAHNLADLHIPQVICMREAVPDLVAQEFLLQFLRSFSNGKSLYISVRESREKLQGLENDFPCASWLPVIFQNLGESPPTWQELCPMSLLTQQQAQNEDAILSTKRVEAWNKWRETNFELVPNLKEVDLGRVDLTGANLSRINLSGANLTGANLSGANLSEANLTGAKLTAVQALNTNFEKALLTGACIEDCNINPQTKLDGVICSYVYMRESQQERCPSSGNFAPGDFTLLAHQLVEMRELVFRNRFDGKAFAQFFQKVKVENEGEPLEIQSIESKGDGFLIKVVVSSDAHKSKIHSEFIEGYELAKETLEAKYKAILDDKDKQIDRLLLVSQEHKDRLVEV